MAKKQTDADLIHTMEVLADALSKTHQFLKSGVRHRTTVDSRLNRLEAKVARLEGKKK